MLTYYYSILAILLIGLICAFIIHRAHREERSESVVSTAKRLRDELKALKRTAKDLDNHSQGKMAWSKRDTELRLLRELHSVRTPWGWSKPSGEKGMLNLSLSEAMQSFSDRLVRQKKHVENLADKPHAKESLRAFIEDRYVPARWNSPNEIEYRKVKAPLLRDPNAPHDQMDSFGVKPDELVRKKLQRVARMNVDAALAASQEELRYVDLKDVKQPWGW